MNFYTVLLLVIVAHISVVASSVDISGGLGDVESAVKTGQMEATVAEKKVLSEMRSVVGDVTRVAEAGQESFERKVKSAVNGAQSAVQNGLPAMIKKL